MTTEHEASRTLVKSPPELWAECSDATSLARHLDQFGDIRITRLEPETAIAWEGAEVRGTVRLEPSGWGTRVIMTARQEVPDTEEPVATEGPVATEEPVATDAPGPREDPEPEEEPPQEPEPQPQPNPLPPAAGAESPRPRLFARLRRVFRGGPRLEPVPIDLAPPPEPVMPSPPPKPHEPPEPPEPQEPQEPQQPQEPEPVVESPPSAVTALTAALDSLGQAHHRPFSRP